MDFPKITALAVLYNSHAFLIGSPFPLYLLLTACSSEFDLDFLRYWNIIYKKLVRLCMLY